MTLFLRGGRKTFGQVSDSVSASSKTPVSQPALSKSQSQDDDLSQIEVLPQYLEVKELIENKFPLIFVTGGAGTGKSTFIRWLDNEFKGTTLVCAPTGIAALTISGKTIHSLCRFPPSWIVDDDIKPHPKSLAKHAKILVIDEISMVNANLLDAMNRFFQVNRDSKEPFGGISVVMVGDLFQLPPIVTHVTKPLFKENYQSPKFFAAHSIQESQFHVVELTKAFRQMDQNFVDLLGNIREGTKLSETLRVLNTSCAITDDPPEGTIWLSPRHLDTERVNSGRLETLSGEIRQYHGVTTGQFYEKQLPVPITVELKVGAQVMMAKNGKEWVNGSVGTVTELLTDRIKVRLTKLQKIVEVPIGIWEQYDYRFNEESRAIERIVVGSYSQLPVVLGWAITIHRSQGLTLDRVHLDLGQGAFETGQTYVALSRCRSISTLTLTRAIRSDDIKVDPESSAFYAEIRG
ncbi:MAG TPA: DEAD/DEAH box helicase [archaeon]|nr:DEAD/DEAH box helicase [archaeon]